MRALIHRFHRIHQRSRIWLITAITIMVLVLNLSPLQAQQSEVVANRIDGFPVALDGNVLFRVRQGIPGTASAQERANIISNRILQVANDNAIAPDSIRVEDRDNDSLVFAGDTVLLTVGERDRVGDLSREATAEKTVQAIKPAVIQYRKDRSFDQIVRSILYGVLSTAAFIAFLILLQRLVAYLLVRIRATRRAGRLDLRFQNYQLIGSTAMGYLLSGVVRFFRLILILSAFLLYVPFVLSLYPTTRPLGQSILNDIGNSVYQTVNAVVNYLPSLIMIIIIAVLTHYIIQFSNLVISELGREDSFTWFYPEWVEPTQRLAALMILAIAGIVIAPLLPGFNSPAFQGISLFLGALFTLGSSSTVANALSGTILIYTRAFRIGDVIRIGDILGEVTEKSLFVTRILTFKREIITIPNAVVLNSNVVNFKAVSRESKIPVVLYTTVTLGYDVPWRKIHQVMIEAAKATPGILSDPSPFVLQKGLNDFNVSYELNAHSDRADIMPFVYSELHENIQDYCNQAGIEILSPAFTALRDGNHSTIPADYLPENYTSPGFQIQNQNNHS
jgi:small-conductance mechanosensitive channel